MLKEEIIFEVLEATGLNWTVSKQPLFFKGNDGGDIVVPKQFTTVRNDTESPLGTVGNQYIALQNHETVEMVYEAGSNVFDQNGEIKHPWNNASTLGSFGNMAGGSLKDGKAVFVQLELPTAHVGRSDIERFITITNHHDGSKAVGFGTTNQVVCCENTFAIANKALTKIRHTASMQERIADATKGLRKMLEFEDQQMAIFEKASTKGFDNKHVRQVMEMMFGGSAKIDDANASQRLKNQVADFAGDVETSICEQGETLWSLFNAVTRYTNHTRSTPDKDYSLMFGTDAQINHKAFKLMEEWVS